MTHYDYGFRIYNPGIARFLSVDPLTSSYPWYTPYQFAGNKPIKFIDLDGLEPADPSKDQYIIAKMVLTTFYDIKHSIENLLLTVGQNTPPGSAFYSTVPNEDLHKSDSKLRFDYATDGNGNQIYKTELYKVKKEGGLKEGGMVVLDIANVIGAKKMAPNDILASKSTVISTQVVKGLKKLLGDTKKTICEIPLTGCEALADKVVKKLGDGAEYLQITPKSKETFYLGKIMGDDSQWAHHVAAIKDGKVYDQLTGAEGLNLEDYKKLYDYQDELDFKPVKERTLK